MPHRYRTLDVERVLETIQQLERRIDDRFPGSGLRRVCGELEDIANETKNKLERIKRPNWWMRSGATLLIGAMVVLTIYGIATYEFKNEKFGLPDLVQMSEAGINDIVLIGAAIFFLFTVETRVKRTRVLKVLYELRSIAHVIDMHQLTKDPNRKQSQNTANSPKIELTPLQLTRYLDYCSEMLSITSKVAALYAQAIEDSVVLQTVNEVEDLTTSLSQKIWQKIMILRDLQQEAEDVPVVDLPQ
jgi:hypothetical protein